MQANNANHLFGDRVGISTYDRATIFSLSPMNTPVFVLLLGHKLSIENSQQWAIMTSFSHAVLCEGVDVQLIRLPGVMHARALRLGA